MKITTSRIKEIIREELSRVNEALSQEMAEESAGMYNSDHWGLSHRQLVSMIMKHGHIDNATHEYLEFRSGHEHNRGDYVEDTEDVDYDTDDQYAEKLNTIKNSYFKSDAKEVVDNKKTAGTNNPVVDGQSDSRMDSVMSAISNLSKK